jgi:hypothetical protein
VVCALNEIEKDPKQGNQQQSQIKFGIGNKGLVFNLCFPDIEE